MFNIRHLVIPLLCLSTVACGGTAQRQEPYPVDTSAKTQTPDLEKHWQLQRFGDTNEALWPAGAAPTLHLQQGRIDGNGGCNRFFGSYRLQGKQIHIDLAGSTMMACADNRLMELEQHYFERLGQTASYRLEGETLQLLDAQQKRLLIFTQSIEQNR